MMRAALSCVRMMLPASVSMASGRAYFSAAAHTAFMHSAMSRHAACVSLAGSPVQRETRLLVPLHSVIMPQPIARTARAKPSKRLTPSSRTALSGCAMLNVPLTAVSSN